MNFRKVAADSDGAEIRRYLTQGAPQQEPVSAIDRAGMNDLREGQKISFQLIKDARTGKVSADKLQAV